MSNPNASPIRRFRLEWFAFGVVLSVIGAVISAALYLELERTAAREADRLQVQARVVDENLSRQLEGVNNALAGIRDGLTNIGSGSAMAAVSDRLNLLRNAMPGVRTLAVLDVSGTIVASSRDESIGKNFKQREYFDVPRQRPDPSVLYVAPSFESSLGKFVIVSRVLTSAGGQFAGVITATLDPDYFNIVLRSVLYAPDMNTTLIHGEGKVLLNVPPSGPALGNGLAKGKDRMVAMRVVEGADLRMDRPLTVVVSRDQSAVYTPWHTKVIRHGVFFAVILLGSGLGLYFSQRRRQAFDRLAATVAKERQQAAERLELALHGADLGLWDLHVPTDTLVVNARECAMLGLSAEEELRPEKWRKLIHPDDWPAVNAALQPHLRGETQAYECEHRMRHKDGRWIWILNRAMVVERDAAGTALRIVGTHLDITERKRTDAELASATEMLQASEEQLRQVTDNMPALVSCIDLEQRFRFVNRTYKDWLDVEPSSLLGRTLREVYGKHAYEGFRHHIDAALAGARVVYEREMATPHGRRHVEITLVPQRRSDGSIQGLYGLMHDLTARNEAELQLARSEQRLSMALEGSGLALFDWDIGSDRIYQSAHASAMRGYAPAETTASPAELQSYVHPDDLQTMSARTRDVLKGVTPVYDVEFRMRNRSGAWLWVRARGRVVERDDGGRALRLAGTYADINERKLSEERLRRLAEFDALTGLPNRAQFQDRLQQALLGAARNGPMALLFLDIDHFKTINDTLGHEAGDQLLKVFAQRMRGSVRQSDTVARLAGDEFTVILEGLHDLSDAKVLTRKLVRALRQPVALAGKPVYITASIGIAMGMAGETDDAALLRRADAALYEAKRRGRDGYFCDEGGTQVEARDAVRSRFDEAGVRVSVE